MVYILEELLRRCRSPTSVEWKDCGAGCAPASRAHGRPAGSADMLVGEWYPRESWFCPSIHPPIFVLTVL